MKSKILFMAILALMLGSCATYQKKLNKFQQFANQNPAELAKLCGNKFPVKTEYLPGRVDTIQGREIVVKGYPIPCPDGTKVTPPDRTVKCPPSTVQHDTLKVEDTAKLFLALDSNAKLNTKVNTLNGQIIEKDKALEDSKSQSKQRLWGLIIMAGALGVGIFLKIKSII